MGKKFPLCLCCGKEILPGQDIISSGGMNPYFVHSEHDSEEVTNV